jgi:tetratricopeptide (TPR) repeat protein
VIAALTLLLLVQGPADTLFERARAAQTAGRLDEAEAAWNEHIRKHGATAEVLANLGALFARRERYVEAVQQYKAALKLNPGLAPLHLNLGLAHLKQGQLTLAISEFDQFLEAQPGHRQAQQLRAMALLEAERYADAEAQYRALASNDPAVLLGLGTALLRQNKAAEARAVLEPMLGDNSPEVQFVMAQMLLQEARVDEALVVLDRVRSARPDLPGLHVAIGTGLWRQRKTAEAITEWRAEDSFEAAYLLGSALSMNNATRVEGEAHLRKAVRLRPGNARANYALGKLIWQRSKDPEALKFLERATQADPLFREAFFLHATALQSLGRKDEAARSFARVKELSQRELARQQDLFSESSP